MQDVLGYSYALVFCMVLHKIMSEHFYALTHSVLLLIGRGLFMQFFIQSVSVAQIKVPIPHVELQSPVMSLRLTTHVVLTFLSVALVFCCSLFVEMGMTHLFLYPLSVSIH